MRQKIINKEQGIRLDIIFLVIGTVCGLWFIFTNAPFHTNDEDRHFLKAYVLAKGNIIPEVDSNKVGDEIPANLYRVVKSYQGIPFHQGVKFDRTKTERLRDVELNPDDKMFYHDYHYKGNPFPYIPAAIGIAIGRIAEASPVWIGWLGRITSLIAYLTLVFLAIRIAPVFKSVFFLYGLTPMVLYQGASVTYDAVHNALSFLLVALYLKYAMQTEKMQTKDFILIIVIALMHSYSKDGYFLIPFLFFIIPPRVVGNYWKMLLMGVFFILLYKIPDWTWRPIVSTIEIEKPPELQKDFKTGFSQNLQHNLSMPIVFLKNIAANILHFRQEWTGGIFGRFGYSYTMLPNAFYIIHGLVLMAAVLFDSKSEMVFRTWQKLIIFIVGFGSIFIIIAGFYFQSPIGAKMIFGIQGRYFIPAIPIILLVLYNSQFENRKWMKWRWLALSVYIAIVLIYSINYLDNALYSN